MGLLGSADPSLDGPSPYTGGESVDICIGTTLRVSLLALPPLDKLGSWSWVACTELPASSSREGSVSAASRYVLIHCVIRALLCSRDIGLAENSYQRLTTASREVLGDLRGLLTARRSMCKTRCLLRGPSSLFWALSPPFRQCWLQVIDSRAYGAPEDRQLPGPPNQRGASHALPRNKIPTPCWVIPTGSRVRFALGLGNAGASAIALVRVRTSI